MTVELRRALSEMERAVGRIEGKLDSFIKQMEVQDNRATGLEMRTRKVEQRLYWFSGAGAVIGTITGFLSTHFFRQ